jgi:hypothetical protein
MKILYIAGAGRSGSTLLEMILGNVPGVFAMGEIRGFWEYLQEGHLLCGCGSPLNACQVWSQVIDRLGLISYPRVAHLAYLSRRFDRTRNLPWLPLLSRLAPVAIKELVQNIGLLYQTVQTVTQARILVDSSKNPSHLYFLRKVPSIDVCVLHLVRDVRAVAYSWSKRRKRQLATLNPDAYMDRRNLVTSALRWMVENAYLHRQGRTLPYYSVVRYEDFTRYPYEELRRALDDLGLQDLDLSLLQASELHLHPTHSVGGNPIRFADHNLRIVADDEWRKKMPAWIQYGLGLLVCPLFFYYKYSLRG